MIEPNQAVQQSRRTPEAQAALSAFVARIGNELDSIAAEVVESWGTQGEFDAFETPLSERCRSPEKVRRWLEVVLTCGDGEVPRQALEAGTASPSAVATMTRLVAGVGLARRRLIRALAWDDRALLDSVLESLDLEVARIIASQLTSLDQLAELGQLVAGVGHELRNPLSAIETSAYLLSRRISDASADPGIERHLEKIRRNVELANRTANALLGWARQRSPRCEQTELRACLDPVLAGLQYPPGVHVGLELPEQLELWCDVDLVRVLLRNLLSNAIEAVGERGTIRVEARHDSSGVAVTISDDGPGLSEQQKLHLFEPLHTTKPLGTGLGLAMSRRIALAHGGRLSLDACSRGASFRLWLPDRNSRERELVR